MLVMYYTLSRGCSCEMRVLLMVEPGRSEQYISQPKLVPAENERVLIFMSVKNMTRLCLGIKNSVGIYQSPRLPSPASHGITLSPTTGRLKLSRYRLA